MIRAYKYLFYRLYQWQVFVGDNDSLASKSACLLITLLLSFTYLDVISYINLLTGYDIELGLNFLDTKYKIVAVGFFGAFANYFFLVRSGKYKKILDEFQSETKSQRARRTLFVWLYVVGVHFLFFLAMYLLMLRNRGELPFFPLRKY